MWRSLLPYLASVLVCLACFLPVSRAQGGGDDASGSSQTTSGQTSTSTAAGPFPWLVAIVFTIIILLVVCMPSRKN